MSVAENLGVLPSKVNIIDISDAVSNRMIRTRHLIASRRRKRLSNQNASTNIYDDADDNVINPREERESLWGLQNIIGVKLNYEIILLLDELGYTDASVAVENTRQQLIDSSNNGDIITSFKEALRLCKSCSYDVSTAIVETSEPVLIKTAILKYLQTTIPSASPMMRTPTIVPSESPKQDNTQSLATAGNSPMYLGLLLWQLLLICFCIGIPICLASLYFTRIYNRKIRNILLPMHEVDYTRDSRNTKAFKSANTDPDLEYYNLYSGESTSSINFNTHPSISIKPHRHQSKFSKISRFRNESKPYNETKRDNLDNMRYALPLHLTRDNKFSKKIPTRGRNLKEMSSKTSSLTRAGLYRHNLGTSVPNGVSHTSSDSIVASEKRKYEHNKHMALSKQYYINDVKNLDVNNRIDIGIEGPVTSLNNASDTSSVVYSFGVGPSKVTAIGPNAAKPFHSNRNDVDTEIVRSAEAKKIARNSLL